MAGAGQLLRTLRVLLVLSIIGPAALFLLAAANDYVRIFHEARGTIQKNVEILHEHALKVFETQELVIDRVNGMLRGYDWPSIAQSEEIHGLLRELDQRLDQISAIWLIGPESRYWAASTQFPAPVRDIGDRPFFTSGRSASVNFWTSSEVRDLDGDGYAIVRWRRNPAQQFDGFIVLAMNPPYFRNFYARLTDNATDTVGLLRGDGTFLLRNLPLPMGSERLSPSNPFLAATAAANEGVFDVTSEVDAISRIVGYRKIGGYDAYVYYGLDRRNVELAWLRRVLTYAVLAAAVGFALFLLTRTALRHAQRTQALQGRLTALNTTLEDRVLDRTAKLEGANERLRRMVAEKELLLREIHHRVKNNLQVVSSLLNLQAGASGKAEEFRDSLRRIRTMADLHESIYQSADISAVPFSNYLGKLADETLSFWISDSRVKCTVEADPLVLDLDTATPLALLANEVLSNACKHAFPDGRAGSITVRLHAADERVRFSVQDDGIGLPGDFLLRREHYLGIRIIDSLARQLGGRADYATDGGTRFTLNFPLPASPRSPA